MPLTFDDLQAYVAELLRQRELIDKKLEASKILMEEFPRESAPQQLKMKIRTHKPHKGSPNNNVALVKKEFEEYKGHEFNTTTFPDIIINKGIREPEDREQLRNASYNYLRKMEKRGFVKRENRGTDKDPDWIYWKIKKEVFSRN